MKHARGIHSWIHRAKSEEQLQPKPLCIPARVQRLHATRIIAEADYFKTESNSFRSLPKTIAKMAPSEVVEAIQAAHARHVADLDYIMAEGRKSVRNRIAHYEFVAAGVINLSRRGFVLLGGGEGLGMPRGATEARLQDVLSSRLERLHACVADMIDSFVHAARSADKL